MMLIEGTECVELKLLCGCQIFQAAVFLNLEDLEMNYGEVRTKKKAKMQLLSKT